MEHATFEGTLTIDVRGASLAYREAGKGPPVILVHGSASDMRTWGTTVPAIAAEHRTIAYSRRYARPNAPIPPGADDPMREHVDDLLSFVTTLSAAPAHLVGHSWGAFVCLLAAIRCPDVVRSLVLIEPPVLSLFVSTPPRPSELMRTFLRSPATAFSIVRFGVTAAEPATKAYRRGEDGAAFEIFGRGVLGKDAFERLSPDRKQQAWENMSVDKAQLLGEGFPPLAYEDVQRVRCPVLLLCGERSPPLFGRLTDRLEALLPNATRLDVSAASHLVHEDDPETVHEAILSFLRGR
ncbi:MAG: alpha/beta hydrolase [Polyangiales bacterium]